MKMTISKSEFIHGFDTMNRGDNFSYEGRRALFEYLCQLEEDLEQEIEFDVIALCCEYSEYEDLEEFLNDYSNTLKTDRKDFEEDEEEEYKKECMEELQNHTTVIKVDDDRFIIHCF